MEIVTIYGTLWLVQEFCAFFALLLVALSVVRRFLYYAPKGMRHMA